LVGERGDPVTHFEPEGGLRILEAALGVLQLSGMGKRPGAEQAEFRPGADHLLGQRFHPADQLRSVDIPASRAGLFFDQVGGPPEIPRGQGVLY
jgi:hypothetical protein